MGPRSWLQFRRRWHHEAVGEVCSNCSARLRAHSHESLETWIATPLDEGWVSALRVEAQAGRPVVTEVRVYRPGGDVPNGGLKARLLGKIRLGQPLAEGLRALMDTRNDGEAVEYFEGHDESPVGSRYRDSVPNRRLPTFEEMFSVVPKRLGPIGLAAQTDHARASSWPDLALAELSANYLDFCHDPETASAPVRALATAYNLKRNHARQLLYRASERGILEGRVHGRSGGSLTDRAIALLSDGPKEEG